MAWRGRVRLGLAWQGMAGPGKGWVAPRAAGDNACRSLSAKLKVHPTEGDTVAEALANVEDAFGAVVEIYQDRGRPLPSSLYLQDANGSLSIETIVSVP